MIEAVIFDMDGLLIDSEPIWRLAEIQIFGNYEIELSDSQCRQTTGLRVDKVVEYWQQQYPDHQLNIDKVANEIVDMVIDIAEKQGKAMPGVYNILDFFKKIELPMAVASSSNLRLITKITQQLNISEYFVTLQSAENLKNGKPHPEVFELTAKKLQVKPQNCLVFEDSPVGVMAGLAANMKVVAVPEKENLNNKEIRKANLVLNLLNQ